MHLVSQYTATDAMEYNKATAMSRDVAGLLGGDGTCCFRGVWWSPDGSFCCVAFEDRLLRIITCDPATGRVSVAGSRAAITAGPLRDFAWCPFMAGIDSTCCILAAQGVPLQMWDPLDGTLRASYTVRKDAEHFINPWSVLWPGTGETLYAGYSAALLAEFDTSRPGETAISIWQSRCGGDRPANAVSSLAVTSGADGLAPIIALGERLGIVELVDTRLGLPAATIRGFAGGLTQVAFCPWQPFHLVGAARGPIDNEVSVFDLRNVSRKLVALPRERGNRNQKHGFCFTDMESAAVITGSSSGKLRGFQRDFESPSKEAALFDFGMPVAGLSYHRSVAGKGPLVACAVGQRPLWAGVGEEDADTEKTTSPKPSFVAFLE